MGFNKRYINKEQIISSFKNNGAVGVSDLYKADAIILPTDSPICKYITKIMDRDETLKYKHHLINIYMMEILEGLYPLK